MADERREGEPASPMVVAPLFAEKRAGERTADSPALDLPPVKKKQRPPRNWTVAASGAVAAVIALVGAAVLFIPRGDGGNAQLDADAKPVTATTAPAVPTAAVGAPTAIPKGTTSKKPVAGRGQKAATTAAGGGQQPAKQPAKPKVVAQPFLFDYFGRSNGSGWGSAWTMGRNPDAGSGGGAAIKNGTGRLTTSDLGNYDGRARVSRRISSLSHEDVDIRFTFHRDDTESYPIVVARADAAVNFHSGYQLSIFDDSFGV